MNNKTEKNNKSLKMKVAEIFIRVLSLFISAFLITIYSSPLISANILNAGNAFGLGIAAILIIFAVFFNPIIKMIKKIWSKSSGKKILIAVLSIVLIGIILFTSTLVSVVSHAQHTASNESTVIVLGCRIWGSTPSRALVARANAAKEHLEKNPDAVAILSGGQGSDENLSEAQAMYNILVEGGINPERLYLEDKSTSTDENILFSKKIIEEKGLSKNVAIATSDYHQKRAEMICKKNGLTATSLPSQSSKYTIPTFYTREVFGVWAQWLKMLL